MINPELERDLTYFQRSRRDIEQQFRDAGIDFQSISGINPVRDVRDPYQVNLFFTWDCDDGILDLYQDRVSDTGPNHILQNLTELCRAWPAKHFVLFHNLVHLERAAPDMPNLHVVNWGSDWLIDLAAWRTRRGPEHKLSSQRFWINLNYKPRAHRLITAALLMGLGVEASGQLRISSYTIDAMQDWQQLLAYQPCQDLVRRYDQPLQRGFDLLKQNQHGGQPDGAAPEPNHDNPLNFDRHLVPLYETSLVEIVSEPVFSAVGTLITEKTYQSMLAHNLPIILASPGTVAYLRDLGFDMFDDVINHGYDSVQDPLQRITSAITDNLELLTHGDSTRQIWQHCRSGRYHNIANLGNLESHYQQHTRAHTRRVISDVLSRSVM